MRIARVTLEDVIARNYDNISHLDFDIKNLVDHLENQSKPDQNIFRKNSSYKTIEDNKNHSPIRLTKKLSFDAVKLQNYQSENKANRKGSFIQRHIKNKQESGESEKKIGKRKTESFLDSKKLHRFLFEMDLPSVNPQQRPKRTKFTIIPPTTPTIKHPQSVKLIRKYENEELPAFLKNHLQNNLDQTTRIEPDLVRRALSMMKIKRKSRIPSLHSAKSNFDMINDRGIRPEVKELRVVDMKIRNERKVKTSQNIANKKIMGSMKRYQQNFQTNGEISAWDVKQ